MDRTLAYAQIGLFGFNFAAIVALSFVVLMNPVQLDPDGGRMQLLQMLIAQLIAVLIMQANYFYQRQRSSSIDRESKPKTEES